MSDSNRQPALLLLINVFVIAICGLVYELVAGALASYVLGDSVTQFSTCIGVYLSAMGLGAWLSKFVDRSPARVFIEVELAVALVGGYSAPLLFIAFASGSFFQVLLYFVVGVIGTLVGLELPLLMRILGDSLAFKDLIARVLTFDYIGALVASIAFPLFLVPQLGLIRTSLVFGMANALVGLWGTWLLKGQLGRGAAFLKWRAGAVLVILVAGFLQADRFTQWSEEHLYDGQIIHSSTSPYQRLVVTSDATGFQLYLSGNLQFSSVDEYRYHEALVHPAVQSFMEQGTEPRRALVLGGGDGLAIRELLKYPSFKSVTLVDLDPAMTSLAKDFEPLAKLNAHSLSDSRVEVVNADAMLWIEQQHEPFDVVIIDFPDPSNYSLGKLYTTRFFRLLNRCVTSDSRVAIQATSPLFTRRCYWCIVRTMEEAGWHVRPYHAAVPSFGIWGFGLAARETFEDPATAIDGLRSLDAQTMQAMFRIPQDLGPLDVQIQRLDNQILVRYHDEAAMLTPELAASESAEGEL